MSALLKCTSVLRCLLSPGKKQSLSRQQATCDLAKQGLCLPRILTENHRWPPGLEVLALGKKWQEEIRQKFFSITEGHLGVIFPLSGFEPWWLKGKLFPVLFNISRPTQWSLCYEHSCVLLFLSKINVFLLRVFMCPFVFEQDKTLAGQWVS